MGTEPEPLTLAEAVHRAVEACDHDARDGALGRLLERFEDADEPIAAVQDIEWRLADAQEGIDAEIEDPAVSMAVATVLYLAFRRDMASADDDHLLRLAARAEWKGNAPDSVVAWLADRGVRV